MKVIRWQWWCPKCKFEDVLNACNIEGGFAWGPDACPGCGDGLWLRIVDPVSPVRPGEKPSPKEGMVEIYAQDMKVLGELVEVLVEVTLQHGPPLDPELRVQCLKALPFLRKLQVVAAMQSTSDKHHSVNSET